MALGALAGGLDERRRRLLALDRRALRDWMRKAATTSAVPSTTAMKTFWNLSPGFGGGAPNRDPPLACGRPVRARRTAGLSSMDRGCALDNGFKIG